MISARTRTAQHDCGRTSLARLSGALLLLTLGAPAWAQSTSETGLSKQLDRIDLAISGTGEFTTNTAGTNYLNQSVSLQPSNTLGALVTARYTAKPYVGFEFNYGYARYTENFVLNATGNTVVGAQSYQLQVQTNVSEFSGGYVAHPRQTIFGLQPFVSVGAGTLQHKPTRGGGQNLPEQYRAAYYYSVGLETPVAYKYFGLRGGFRQVFFKAPDFLTNYLTDQQRSTTSEPFFGFFVRF